MQQEARSLFHEQDWRWVEPSDFHITILFLGDVLELQAASVCKTLGRGIEGKPQISYRLGGPGGFEGRYPGNVLALMASPAESFLPLRSAAEAAAMDARISADLRGLRPHITLARRRTKGQIEEEALTGLAKIVSPEIEFVVESLGLYRSFPHPAKPKYECLESWTLAG